jgi:hypothetical protein
MKSDCAKTKPCCKINEEPARSNVPCERCNYRNPPESAVSDSHIALPSHDLTMDVPSTMIFAVVRTDAVRWLHANLSCAPPPNLRDLFHTGSLLLI